MSKKKEIKVLTPNKPVVSTTTTKKENDVTASEALAILQDIPEGKESHEPSATQPIPPVKEKVDKPEINADEIIDGQNVHSDSLENELAFGHFNETRSMKFKVDPDTVKAPAYAVEDFREFFEKFRNEKDAKPNILFINTNTLERLGYRDVAVSLGLHIKESTVYNHNELVLALDL